jgi:hypothetical protein
MAFRRCTDFAGGKVKKMRNELVGMLRFNPIGLKYCGGKIPEIKRDNDTSSCLNRGGEHMPIVRVWPE